MTSTSTFQFSRRRVLQLLSGVTGGLVLHACTSPDPEGAETTPTEMMSLSVGSTVWIGLTPLFIAQDKGFFRELGLEVEFKSFGANSDYVAAFLAGQIDAVAPVTSEVVSLAAKEKDFRIVLVEDTSIGGDGILARNRIESIEAFKGERIAVDRGGVSHFFLLQVLEEVGLSESDVTLVNADPPSAAAAYQAGNIDVAVTYAPFMQRANEAQEDGRIIYDSSKMPMAIADVYAFDLEFLEANPQIAEAFVKGIFKGLSFLETNPEEGLEIAAKQFEVTPEALAADLKGIQFPDAEMNLEMLGDPESNLYLLKSLTDLAEFLKSQGQIDTIPDLEPLLEPKFVEAVMEEGS
ncbi:ABC transporter substrate-binding protein [Baaleninema simplex]|uniref:ABC transporter substrate-binding protein n=1 Tax=Baaleninema simplex TaxID=2862350 RepID=UPI000554D37C|nr:ABC transporter substrate-binding protein [Baaleninema simplex]